MRHLLLLEFQTGLPPRLLHEEDVVFKHSSLLREFAEDAADTPSALGTSSEIQRIRLPAGVDAEHLDALRNQLEKNGDEHHLAIAWFRSLAPSVLLAYVRLLDFLKIDGLLEEAIRFLRADPVSAVHMLFDAHTYDRLPECVWDRVTRFPREDVLRHDVHRAACKRFLEVAAADDGDIDEFHESKVVELLESAHGHDFGSSLVALMHAYAKAAPAYEADLNRETDRRANAAFRRVFDRVLKRALDDLRVDGRPIQDYVVQVLEFVFDGAKRMPSRKNGNNNNNNNGGGARFLPVIRFLISHLRDFADGGGSAPSRPKKRSRDDDASRSPPRCTVKEGCEDALKRIKTCVTNGDTAQVFDDGKMRYDNYLSVLASSFWLFRVIYADDAETLKALLSVPGVSADKLYTLKAVRQERDGYYVNARIKTTIVGQDRLTPLHYAALCLSANAAEALLERKTKKTFAHKASCQMLVPSETDSVSRSFGGSTEWTVFHAACAGAYLSSLSSQNVDVPAVASRIVKSLKTAEAGCSSSSRSPEEVDTVFQTDGRGFCSLHYALMSRSATLVKTVVDVAEGSRRSTTAGHQAGPPPSERAARDVSLLPYVAALPTRSSDGTLNARVVDALMDKAPAGLLRGDLLSRWEEPYYGERFRQMLFPRMWTAGRTSLLSCAARWGFMTLPHTMMRRMADVLPGTRQALDAFKTPLEWTESPSWDKPPEKKTAESPFDMYVLACPPCAGGQTADDWQNARAQDVNAFLAQYGTLLSREDVRYMVANLPISNYGGAFLRPDQASCFDPCIRTCLKLLGVPNADDLPTDVIRLVRPA